MQSFDLSLSLFNIQRRRSSLQSTISSVDDVEGIDTTWRDVEDIDTDCEESSVQSAMKVIDGITSSSQRSNVTSPETGKETLLSSITTTRGGAKRRSDLHMKVFRHQL